MTYKIPLQDIPEEGLTGVEISALLESKVPRCLTGSSSGQPNMGLWCGKLLKIYLKNMAWRILVPRSSYRIYR